MLEVRDLCVDYGKIRALDGVNVQVGEAQTVAVVGANGAGKSSFMNAVCGLVRKSTGTVRLHGQDITRLPSHRIFERGIALVPEGRLIVGGLTVRENLELAARRREPLREVLSYLPRLAERLDTKAAALSGGEAQMLAIARALVRRPRTLLLDEPSLGLAPAVVADIFRLIGRLKGDGLTIVLVEQNVHQALTLADRAYVFESGRITLEGQASVLARDERLADVYMGLHGRSG